jgi:hypothetical protein
MEEALTSAGYRLPVLHLPFPKLAVQFVTISSWGRHDITLLVLQRQQVSVKT